MKYPLAFLIPVLMIVDYYLTILGYHLYSKYYSKHIQSEQYELNPILQSDINKRRFLSWRHLTGVLILIGIALFVNLHPVSFDPFYAAMIFGMIITIYCVIIANHINMILTFLYIRKYPEMLSGQATFSYPLVLKMSQYRILPPLFILLPVALFLPSPFVFGGLAGLLILMLIHETWLSRYQRKMSSKATDSEKIPEPSFSVKLIRFLFTIACWFGTVFFILIIITTSLFCRYTWLITIIFAFSFITAIVLSSICLKRYRAVFIFVITLVTFLMIWFIFEPYPPHNKLLDEGSEIVEAIEQYKAEQNQYPQSLDQLNLKGLNWRYGGWTYQPNQDSSDFLLKIGNYDKDYFELYWDTEDTSWYLDD